MSFLLLPISILPETRLNDSGTHTVFPLHGGVLQRYLFYLMFTKTLSGRDDYYPSDFAKRKCNTWKARGLSQVTPVTFC